MDGNGSNKEEKLDYQGNSSIKKGKKRNTKKKKAEKKIINVCARTKNVSFKDFYVIKKKLTIIEKGFSFVISYGRTKLGYGKTKSHRRNDMGFKRNSRRIGKGMYLWWSISK